MKGVVSRAIYQHFATLTVAISILLDTDSDKRNHFLPYARELLCYYVKTSQTLYGEKFIVYNVHNLTHIADDVENHGCSLNEICGFPFENHLQTIKKQVRNSKSPITQVAKRLAEVERAGVSTHQRKHFRFISTKPKDNCFLLGNDDFVFVREKRDNGCYACDVVKRRDTADFFEHPCKSSMIDIVYIKNNVRTRRMMLQFFRKVVSLPRADGHVLVPMLHGEERNYL